jgi:hypothetical protein
MERDWRSRTSEALHGCTTGSRCLLGEVASKSSNRFVTLARSCGAAVSVSSGSRSLVGFWMYVPTLQANRSKG